MSDKFDHAEAHAGQGFLPTFSRLAYSEHFTKGLRQRLLCDAKTQFETKTAANM